MDPRVVNILIRDSFDIVGKWTQRLCLSDKTETNPLTFLDSTGISLYRLVIVGGVALNSSIRRQYPTRDMDLKLVYNRIIEREEYFDLYRTEFNPLRARIILELVKFLNRRTAHMSTIFDDLLEYHVREDGAHQYFRAAINYFRPYYFSSISGVLAKIEQTRNEHDPNIDSSFRHLTEMVFSVVYRPRGGDRDCTLIDLTMFTNLRSINPVYQPGNLETSQLYHKFYNRMLKYYTDSEKDIVPSKKIPQVSPDVRFTNIGFILYDNYLLIYKHHDQAKQYIVRQRLEYLLDQLIYETRKRGEKYQEVLNTLTELAILFSDPDLDPIERPDDYDQQVIDQKIELVINYQTENLLPSYNHYRQVLPTLRHIKEFYVPFTLDKEMTQNVGGSDNDEEIELETDLGLQLGNQVISSQSSIGLDSVNDVFIDDSYRSESDLRSETLLSDSDGGGNNGIKYRTGPIVQLHERYPVSLYERCLGSFQREWIENWRNHFQQSDEQVERQPIPPWSSEYMTTPLLFSTTK